MSTHRVAGDSGIHAILAGMVLSKYSTRAVTLRRSVDLTTSATTSVVARDTPDSQTTSACSFGVGGESAAQIHIMANDTTTDSGLLRLFGFAGVSNAVPSWNVPWRSGALYDGFMSGFDLDQGGGTAFFMAAGALMAMLTPGSSEMTTLATGEWFVRGAGEGDLAIWSKSQTGDYRIEGWAPNGGVRTIIPSMATDTCSVAISPTRLAGFTGDNSGQYCSSYPNPRFWTTPRAYSPSEVKLTQSPPFSPNPHYVGKMVTWGDFLVAHVRDETVPPGPHNATVFYLLVARVTDWKLRKIQPGGDDLVHGSAFTLTDTHLYAAFQKTLANESDRIETIRRYDLSKFDQIGDPM
jgi:hypothetical protein